MRDGVPYVLPRILKDCTYYWEIEKSEMFFKRLYILLGIKVRKMFCIYILLWIKSERFLKDVLYIYGMREVFLKRFCIYYYELKV